MNIVTKECVSVYQGKVFIRNPNPFSRFRKQATSTKQIRFVFDGKSPHSGYARCGINLLTVPVELVKPTVY
jgi:hypothetical protein